jgi:hypothetical protein
MVVRELVGVALAVLVLAGISVAIINGGQSAAVLGAAGTSFSDVIRAATAGGGGASGGNSQAKYA